MINTPTTYNYGGSGQFDLMPPKATPTWGTGEQQTYGSAGSSAWAFAKLGAGIGAIGLAGTLPYGRGNVWDKYLQGLRFLEERSPAKFARTFQLSTWMSPFGSAAQAEMFIPGEQWGKWLAQRGGATPLGGYYQSLLGSSIAQQAKLTELGATLSEGKLYLGKAGGEVLLEHAAAMTAPFRQFRGMEEYARGGLGYLPGELSLFEEMGPKGKQFAPTTFMRSGQEVSEYMLITGGKTRGQAAYRTWQGIATDLVQRFNRLLWGTQEQILKYAPGGKKLTRAIPEIKGLLGLGVERELIEGTGRIKDTHTRALRTLGKMGLKFGIGLPLLVGAWQTADWATRELGTEGINAWIGKGYMYGRMGLSAIAEMTGLHAYREWQEDVAPGSTSLIKLAAFPATGAFLGAVGGYVHKQRVYSHITEKFQETLLGMSGDRAAKFEARMGGFIERGVEGALKKATWQGKLVRWAQGEVLSNKLLSGRIGESLRVMKPTALRATLGAAAVGALALPFLPGALVPSDRPDTIERQMTGEEDVAVRKGRWWPMGRTSFEGDKVQYYRPHLSAIMAAKPMETNVFGGPTSPMAQWYLKNFTYDLEEKNYWSYPAAMSGPAFADVPIFGPLLAGTIGQVVKPPRYYHMEDWLGEGGGTLYPQARGGTLPIVGGLGGEAPGALRPPGQITDILGEQAYRLQDLVGLPGYALEAIKQNITGRPGWFDEEARLRTAGAMYGSEEQRGFWEAAIGDPLGGLTEPYRRLYPHAQNQIQRVEPLIRNNLPDWLPGPGSKSPDFLHGMGYLKVPMGDALLPGPGFAKLHPELEGVDPNDYSSFWKYYVLARVAPYSDEYKESVRNLRFDIEQGIVPEEQVARFEKIREQVRGIKGGETFFNRQFTGPGASSARDMLLEANRKAQRGEGAGLFGSILGGYWETIGLNLETPVEALTPFAPASKLLHMRTALQAYEREQVYGKKMAQWGTPYESFIEPFFHQIARGLGWEGIPERTKRNREITEYFDILKYTKYTRLKMAAQDQGDYDAAKYYEDLRRSTLTGVNVMGKNFSNIYRALPRSERDYYRAFADETLDVNKAEILKLVPEVEKPLLTGQWQISYKQALQKAINADELVGMSEGAAEDEIEQIEKMQESEGFPVDTDLYAEYEATRLPKESYADWYRRQKIAKRLEQIGMGMPGPDFVGWHPGVDLDDVKMKYILEEDLSMYEHDLWPDRMMTLPYKSYIDTDAIDELRDTMDKEEVEDRLHQLFRDLDIPLAEVIIRKSHGQNEIDVDISYDIADQMGEMQKQLEESYG